MNDYHALRADITPCNEDMTDYLAAMLADVGYESFVPDSTGLTAYIKAEDFDPSVVESLYTDWPFGSKITTKHEFIEGRDWNAEWEKNYFKPIIFGDRCVIHSSFHTNIPTCEYDIVIDPKMAFGTGHHATTSLIIEKLIDTDLAGKTVIDMGTGTGILAILAAMRGASDVYGVEIDPFAYENAVVNTKLNNHPEITIINGDRGALDTLPQCDVFIANINRNIITGDLQSYAGRLKPGGMMLLSGFYEHDIEVVTKVSAPLGLKETGHTVKGDLANVREQSSSCNSSAERKGRSGEVNNWTCLVLVKQ